jgi:hypothetical protein
MRYIINRVDPDGTKYRVNTHSLRSAEMATELCEKLNHLAELFHVEHRYEVDTYQIAV